MKVKIVALGALMLVGEVQAGNGFFCKAGEALVFSCSHGSKTAEICAAEDEKGALRYVQYRYGGYGKARPEIAVPALNVKPGAGVKGWATTGTGAYSQGMEFSQGRYVYSIDHTEGFRGPETPAALSVQKDGKPVTSFDCSIDVDHLYDFITKHPVLTQDSAPQ